MSVPTTTREELYVSAIGQERAPSSVLAKGSFWSVFVRNQSVYVTEYEGSTFLRIIPDIEKSYVTPALDSSNNLVTDRFWVWAVTTDSKLILYEIEPFSDSYPTIHYTQEVFSFGVKSVRVDLVYGASVKLYVLFAGSPDIFRHYIYSDIKSGTPDSVSQFDWTTSRIENLDAETPVGYNDKFDLIYVDTASPPNIYTIDYGLSVPQITALDRIGATQVRVEWDEVLGGEAYRLERSLSASFPPGPTEIIYSGPDLTYTDDVPMVGRDYYYRVKLVMPSLLAESDWSDTATIYVAGEVPVDFVGVPRAGNSPLTVDFTNLTVIPAGLTLDEWVWYFGDGETSNEENPTHVYLRRGYFTVKLVAKVSFA